VLVVHKGHTLGHHLLTNVAVPVALYPQGRAAAVIATKAALLLLRRVQLLLQLALLLLSSRDGCLCGGKLGGMVSMWFATSRCISSGISTTMLGFLARQLGIFSSSISVALLLCTLALAAFGALAWPTG
jgi:hypothetical protein